MPTPRMSSGIRACCRLVMRAARHRSRAVLNKGEKRSNLIVINRGAVAQMDRAKVS